VKFIWWLQLVGSTLYSVATVCCAIIFSFAAIYPRTFEDTFLWEQTRNRWFDIPAALMCLLLTFIANGIRNDHIELKEEILHPMPEIFGNRNEGDE
jgi:hypothetical protein